MTINVIYTESQYVWRMTLPAFGHVLIVWAEDGGYGQVRPAAESQQLEGASMTFDPFPVSCRIKHDPDLAQIIADAVNADGYDKATGETNHTYTLAGQMTREEYLKGGKV